MRTLRKYLANPYAVFVYLGNKGLLKWLPDAAYLKLLYRGRLGRRLDLDAPRTFNEKLQWLKLHDRDPRYTALVDKYAVKEIVADLLGPQAVVPTLGMWEDASQIDFAQLPNQFVLKTNHNSGGVIICRDKSALNTRDAAEKMNAQLKRPYFWATREWPYKNVRPIVFAEEYLPDAQEETQPKESHEAGLRETKPGIRGIVDYKFYCFHGEPLFLYVSQGFENHATARVAFLDLDWNPMGFGRSDYHTFDEPVQKPTRLPEMIKAARLLAADIPFVRVDLFEHRDTVLFSEMTFHPAAGMMPFVPGEADYEVGKMLDLERR